MSRIGRETYRDKVYACWLGKSIGGTLGGPHEGNPGPMSLTFYDPVPTEPAFNDDLDLQLIWLHALEVYGVTVTPAQISKEWRDHNTYPWCEYGYSQLSSRRGLIPPVTGSYDNWFGDCMGAPIRSEIWACSVPGAPHMACEYAWRDAIRDHWGEGVWGEMFFAAVESSAFVLDDRDTLLDIGLAAIPPWSRTARAITQVRDSFAAGYDWLTARARVLSEFAQQHMTNAPMNLGFTVLGWLYGEDFGDALLKAVNCGGDTDCTGATLGAILGILGGSAGIPARWREPISDGIKVGWGIHDLNTPEDLDSLTDRTCAVGETVAKAFKEAAILADGEGTAGDAQQQRRFALQAMHIWDRRPDEVWLTDDAGVRFWYMGGPSVSPGRPKRTLVVGASGVGIKAPEGWEVSANRVDNAFELQVTPAEDMPAYASIEVTVEGEAHSVAFVRKPRWQAARLPHDQYGEDFPEDALWLPWEPAGHQMDLTPFLGGAEGVIALRTRLISPEASRAAVYVATTHHARAWLNGAKVIEKESLQPNDPPPYWEGGDRRAEVDLKAGANDLKVLLQSRGGLCWVRIYVTDLDNHGLPEVYYEP